MSLEELKKSYRSYKRLLEADTLGYFDFFTCIVCLTSVNRLQFEQFQEARVSKNYSVLSKISPLLAHELTHFVDSTSTVWGMNHLKKMNEAYCSNYSKGGTEHEFYKAKSFLEHVRSLRLPSYYTFIDGAQRPTRPWRYRMTMGKQFGLDGKLSETPILFSHFSNAHGELLARSPVSAVSILEASAMSNEMATRLALINNLGEDERLVGKGVYQREIFNYIYDQNITEYSVCVHVVANHLGLKDIFLSFQICAIITRLVLNFPKSMLDKVIEGAEIHDIVGVPKGHEFEDRMKAGIKSHNLGVLFYLICKSLPAHTAESRDKIIIGVDNALIRMGVSLKLIADEAIKEVEEISLELSESRLRIIAFLSKAGADNFSKIPLTSTGLDFSALSLPSVYLEDGTEGVIFNDDNNVLKGIGIEEIFDELYEGQGWVERFSEACTA